MYTARMLWFRCRLSDCGEKKPGMGTGAGAGTKRVSAESIASPYGLAMSWLLTILPIALRGMDLTTCTSDGCL